jgi:FkbM family methyltransferase
VSKYLRKNDLRKQKTFLEIGTSDFNTLLPLCRNGWSGILVEPIPLLAENLRKEIAAEGLQATVLNMAISDHDGELQMRKIVGHEYLGLTDSVESCGLVSTPVGSEAFEKVWFKGTSYVDLSKTGGSNGTPADDRLSFEEITVKCMKLSSLMQRFEIHSLDLMQIDVEGHELHILESYDFRIHPMVVKVEHEHMPANGRDLKDIVKLLENNKYHTFVEEKDIYGIY